MSEYTQVPVFVVPPQPRKSVFDAEEQLYIVGILAVLIITLPFVAAGSFFRKSVNPPPKKPNPLPRKQPSQSVKRPVSPRFYGSDRQISASEIRTLLDLQERFLKASADQDIMKALGFRQSLETAFLQVTGEFLSVIQKPLKIERRNEREIRNPGTNF